ncbi:MAG TPA: hypothetical protein VF275_06330 [Gammaproteobacteria bacterium]
MTIRTILAAAILLLSSACALWNKPPDTIAYACFPNAEAANVFARYGMRKLIDFSEATGTGTGKTGLTIWTIGPNPCESGSVARLADNEDVYSSEEEALFRDAFLNALDSFRATH